MKQTKKSEVVGQKTNKVTDTAKKPDQIVLNPKTVDDNGRLNERVVDVAQRVKRRALMKRVHAKLARRKQIARFRLHTSGQISQKSAQMAKQMLRRRFAGPRGAAYKNLSAYSKQQIDQIVDKKAQLIRSMAMKLAPRLKAADVRRLQAVRSKRGVKGIKSYLGATPLNQSYEYDIEFLMSLFEQITDKDRQALEQKSIQHNVDYPIVEMVFLRGLVESNKDEAFNRVNSFLSNGLAAKIDNDLSEAVWDQPKPEGKSKSMTPDQKAEAKRRAKAAGRPYPNLVDNMAAMKEQFIISQDPEIGDAVDIEVTDTVYETSISEIAEDGVIVDVDQAAFDAISSAGTIEEAEYQGRDVPLGKPMAGDVKKSKVYVRGPSGNVVKVNFGDKNMSIKKHDPVRRRSFRARHNCDNPGPRHKARYWSCRAW